ncbi:MAG: tRNA (guanosine(37)-N1)-methyltransferase TrmD [Candidatus Azosocius agrarius]|nr:MAG: tRNA (guanosine(37)-N1)-methyltransferase TrmD [Gammaproteobacteria bacterium]
MWIGIITIFPEMFVTVSNYGILSKAIKNGSIKFFLFNPRYFIKKFFLNCKPYGDIPGVLLSVDILKNAINYAKLESSNVDTKVVYLSPKGTLINQNVISNILSYKSVIFISGRYEGIDERLFNFFIDEEISFGDFIFSGGENILFLLLDSIVRLLPNVLGNINSVINDSFIDYVLDAPHYTKPKLVYNVKIPKNLLFCNNLLIKDWNIKYKLGCTFFKRRELFNKFKMSKIKYMLLRNFILENREVL